MKKRLISVLVAMMMLLSLWPASAFAEYAAEIEVTDFAEMAAVLPSGETAPDSRGIVWTPVARMTESITVGNGQEVTTLGKLIVSSNTTLTIKAGGVIEAEVYVEPNAVVHVESGGELRTTMAGEDAIFNEGTIMIDSGGVLVSQGKADVAAPLIYLHLVPQGGVEVEMGLVVIGILLPEAESHRALSEGEGEIAEGKGEVGPVAPVGDVGVEESILIQRSRLGGEPVVHHGVGEVVAEITFKQGI